VKKMEKNLKGPKLEDKRKKKKKKNLDIKKNESYK
jgi:hypothetical protein